MIKQYRQELRPTGTPGEFQMFYIEETLSPEVESEIEVLKVENDATALKDSINLLPE